MKILYCVRLFSGLRTSVLSAAWKPTGVPTIFKMMEALDRGSDTCIPVLTNKDSQTALDGPPNHFIQMDGLSSPILLLSGAERFPKIFGRVRGPLREWRHFIYIRRLYLREKPDLVYLDHANIFVAALLSATTRARIVLRIMGIYPFMRDVLTGSGLLASFMRWCYRRPYALVICTQDGSGVEPWLERALDLNAPRITLLNGLDASATTNNKFDHSGDPHLKTKVMFLGKLEPAKGVLEFADAFLAALKEAPKELHALVIGSGSQKDALLKRFAKAGAADNLTLVEHQPHAQVMDALRRADIYISLNRLGNLSNANLEAMMTGRCMIIPKAQAEKGIDLVTDQILPKESALRIACVDDVAGLAEAILHLHRNPEERRQRGAAAANAARHSLSDWKTRINRELALLHHVAKGGDVLPVHSDQQQKAAQQ